MDYFVSINNNLQHFWQARLLLESFKYHNLQDSLSIAVADGPNFDSLLFKHQRIFKHQDMGVRNGPYALHAALYNQSIHQPVTVITPDYLLYKPLNVEDTKDPHIVFQVDSDYTPSCATRIEKYLPKRDWVPLGKIMYFNGLPTDIFERAAMLTEVLIAEEIMEEPDRIAWTINIMDLLGYCKVSGEYNLEMDITDDQIEHNFINYKKGVPPFFSKTMFSYSSEIQLSLGNPFEALAKLETVMGTKTSEYVAKLARNCLSKR
jgi:hypothetical protein